MATYTNKYDLKKPAPSDFADVADLNNNMDIIDEVLDKKSNLTYCTCGTSASTSAKVATVITGTFELKTGVPVDVKFTYANTASAPTLNVGGTGAKTIKKYGTTAPSANMWQAGAIVRFIYDGTYWVMQNGTTATTTYYGVTKLNSSVNSTSTTEAATPSAVKQAYDKANTAIPSTQKAAANGVASLDAEGKIPSAQLPDIAGKRTCRFVVGTSTAGWTAADVDYLCDGTADDVEINAALRALPSTGGEIVILDGTYNINSPILIYKNCIFKGSNRDSTIFCRNYDSNNAVISVTGSPNSVLLEQFSVDGKNNTYTTNYYQGVSILPEGDYRGYVVQNVRVFNSGIGILVHDCLVRDCECTNNLKDGIDVYGKTSTIENNICFNNNNAGIYLQNLQGDSEWDEEGSFYRYDGITRTIISNNKCCLNRVGINAFDSYGITITNNFCNNNTREGIELYTWLDDTNGGVVENAVCMISNNQCVRNGSDGIYVTAGISPDIDNTYGIKLPVNIITSNFCSDNSRNAIYLGGDICASICSNNMCLVSKSGGSIEVEGENNLVANNVCNKNYVNNGATNNTFLNNKIC